ncbi:MAG: hypothetical protein HZA20_11425 [Nitrospirae bacterium]|nr:hypothetical protein [Nitrospirota bacterium]
MKNIAIKGTGFRFLAAIIIAAVLPCGCIYKTIDINEDVREIERTSDVELNRSYRLDPFAPGAVKVSADVEVSDKVRYEVVDMVRQGRAGSLAITGDIFLRGILGVATAGLTTAIVSLTCPDSMGYLGICLHGGLGGTSGCPGGGCSEERVVDMPKRTEIRYENLECRRIPITSGEVAVYLEGRYVGNVPVSWDSVAEFHLGEYPAFLGIGRDIDMLFKFKDAAIPAAVPYDVYVWAVKVASPPCGLTATAIFVDDGGYRPNGLLDAAEKAQVSVVVRNAGPGPAFGVAVESKSDNNFIKVPLRMPVGDIQAGDSKLVKVPISSIYKLSNGNASLSFTAVEERGFVSGTVVTNVETRAMSEGSPPPEQLIR